MHRVSLTHAQSLFHEVKQHEQVVDQSCERAQSHRHLELSAVVAFVVLKIGQLLVSFFQGFELFLTVEVRTYVLQCLIKRRPGHSLVFVATYVP